MTIDEEALKRSILNKENILNLIDEWTLYCHYLGYEPELGPKYRSPIREVDEFASFSVYEATREPRDVEYLWKDNGVHESGDIFKLIKLIFGLSTYYEVFCLVNTDFELGFGATLIKNKIISNERPEAKPPSVIRIQSCDFTKQALEYWKQYGVSEGVLHLYSVKQVVAVWYYEDQEYPMYSKSLTFAYPEYESKLKEWQYQIYAPFEDKRFKFINNYTHNIYPGFRQLTYEKDICFITKSKKDILMFRELGYDSIAGRSETTLISRECINYLKIRYKHVIVWQDPDNAGYTAAREYNTLYGLPWITIYPCLLYNVKDPTDFYKAYGRESTLSLILFLLNTII